MIYHDISKTPFLLQKHAITAFLSRKFMITRSSIVFENLLASSIAPQVMPHCRTIIQFHSFFHRIFFFTYLHVYFNPTIGHKNEKTFQSMDNLCETAQQLYC